MLDRPSAGVGRFEPVGVTNEIGSSPFVLVCDHASNHLPETMGTLGLPAEAMTAHIAWDPGAVEVARLLSASLDAALVESQCSHHLSGSDRGG